MENRSKDPKIIIIVKELLLRAKRKRPSLAASITVETSLILPIYLFFFINLLGVFSILKLQCDLEAAIHQTGREMMVNEATVRTFARTHDGGAVAGASAGAIDAVTAGGKVKSYLGEEYLNKSVMNDGAQGLSLAETTLYSNGDILDIVATYKAHPFFRIAAFTDFSLEGRFYGHAFTGYDPSEGSNNVGIAEELVYITEHGTAYHRSLDCSHLRLSVRQASKADITAARNADGSKYYPCEYCGSRAGNTVYITNYGTRYHSNRSCGGIKRTIKTVPISEAIGRTPCSECAR